MTFPAFPLDRDGPGDGTFFSGVPHPHLLGVCRPDLDFLAGCREFFRSFFAPIQRPEDGTPWPPTPARLPCRGLANLSAVGISPQQFAELEARTRGQARKNRVPCAIDPGPSAAQGIRHERILGIDPSLRGTGWGVIQHRPDGMVALGFGTLSCPAGWERSRCLVRIAAGLREAIQMHQPTTCAIEGLFFAQNLQTALIMGEARGVCLLAAAEAGLEICEIAPRKVKQAIVGFGGAQKAAVARMVQRLLGLAAVPDPDPADALALALVQARETSRYRLPARRSL